MHYSHCVSNWFSFFPQLCTHCWRTRRSGHTPVLNSAVLGPSNIQTPASWTVRICSHNYYHVGGGGGGGGGVASRPPGDGKESLMHTICACIKISGKLSKTVRLLATSMHTHGLCMYVYAAMYTIVQVLTSNWLSGVSMRPKWSPFLHSMNCGIYIIYRRWCIIYCHCKPATPCTPVCVALLYIATPSAI